jgi:type IV secretory pathway VirB10-like protein
VRPRFLVAGLAALLATAGAARPVAAQSDEPSIDLVVIAGRPLRISLEARIRLDKVGQPVVGTVTEPVYAYDRIVIAAGTRVRGHVSQIDGGSKFVRARAYLNGNFSPPKHAVLQFDTLLLDTGDEVPIDTVVKGGIPNVTRKVAGGSSSTARTGAEQAASNEETASPGLGSRARSEIRQRTTDAVSEAKQKVRDGLASIKSLRDPGQMTRLKDAAVQQLPYHPQYLAKGTVYDAELSSPISFGRAIPALAAPVGTAPAPDSILTARLATTLDSSKTPRGTPFEAVITETVFSADHQVVLPEGTKLTGEVTFATPARRFRRNGRLRFLFQTVQVPNQAPAPLLGALHAIDASNDDHVAVDDEGGATLENSKTRFIAPALSLLSLHASMEGDHHSFADPDGDGSIKTAGSGVGSRGVGGFIGMGLIGAAVSQITRPVGIAMGVYGAARTIYTNVLGKGREVTFPADTPIQVRLAPGPSAR